MTWFPKEDLLLFPFLYENKRYCSPIVYLSSEKENLGRNEIFVLYLLRSKISLLW
jgi:hypothetical protein